MTGSQRGSAIGGTWLISLGLVFLAQRALDHSTMALGTTRVDEARFPRGDGWASPDVPTASRVAGNWVNGGVGGLGIS